MPPKQLPEGLSIQTVAAILDVHVCTVRRWIHSNYIIAHRVGPHLIRIPRSEIQRLRTIRLQYTKYGDRVEYPTV